ncbi:unnamed protein product [Prorocentrum cordatum]|uniref:PDZ domain-containing protein n=1 Tax=Prorocentrum cordatum TaxID=2364126 RepID=A0ABN9XUS6_9DINO|nr:unnamed protein product [Polarella glacialis]
MATRVSIPAGCSAGFECSREGAVEAVSPDGHLKAAGVCARDGWRLLAINGEPVEEATFRDALQNARRSGKDYELTFVQPVSQPLLGTGIPLLGCQAGVPHLYVLPALRESCGTVLLLHGSGPTDWLGNQDPTGTPTEGGVTEMAFEFREQGFTSVVLDSYAAGRRQGKDFKTSMRVDDIMAALQYVRDAGLPGPIHIYGKSNGGYSVAMFLQLPVSKAEASRKDKAKELAESLASVIIQCPYLSQERDVERLRRVAEESEVNLPNVLFLLAAEDRMLTDHKQPMNVGVQAAEAMAGQLVTKWQEPVMKGRELLSNCSIQQGGGSAMGRPFVEVRMYSDIGHTFVADAEGQAISDGSCTPVVQHALRATVSWMSWQTPKPGVTA